MRQKFFIGIPTINRADLLNEALKKYSVDFPTIQIYIVDNGSQDILKTENTYIMCPSNNYGVAKSWNWLLNVGFDSNKNSQYGLILNDDIYLGKGTMDILDLLKMSHNPDFLCGNNHWCAFMISRKLFKTLGRFDETFYPAYYEDNDYAYRMKLAGSRRVNTDVLDPEIFRNSQTIAKDPSLNQNFQKNRDYFIKKWGGLPEQEKFTTPFNLDK